MTERKFKIKIDGKVFVAEVEEIITEKEEGLEKHKKKYHKEIKNTFSSSSEKTIAAPMPGKVIEIKVEKGKKVKKGDVVLILEAMKMEQEIKSEIDGYVEDISVKEGEAVTKEQILITIN